MLLALILIMPCFGFEAYAQQKTGVGMAQWALRAYNEGWKYVFGGEEVGAVDCSGLIRSYTGCWDNAGQLLKNSPESGSAADIPNIHGLGLWCEGHCGVYVGKNSEGTNMAVDARNSRVNVVYSTMDSRSWNPWVKWFKIEGVEYPETGWVEFNGSTYYYHKGEYVTGYFEIKGKLYDFGKSGALRGEVDEDETTTTKKTTTTTKKTTTTKSTTTSKTTTTTTATKTTKSTTTTAAANNLLKLGMSGDKVIRLQTRLKELGYLKAKVTGYYGEQTVMAVRMFQKQVGLSPDGVAGEKTQELLFAQDAPTRSSSTKTTTTTTTTTAATTTTTTKQGEKTTTTKSTTTASTASTTTTTTPEQYYASLYSELEFGMRGKAVESLIDRLIELGYYEQESDNYYGVFARLAVMAFQINAGLNASGVADPETQYLLYLESAPKAGEEPTSDMLYSSEDLQFDEGELVEEVSEEVVIVDSNGLGAYSANADMVYFISKFSDSDKLQTFGVLGFEEPTVTIYQAGESFELSGELSEAIDNCVFF